MSDCAALARALQRVGFPNASVESLEWLFEQRSCLSFLDWLCDNIQPENIITDDEIESYTDLLNAGEGILEGDKLEEAVSNAQGYQDEIPNETLQNEIESASKTVESMNKRLHKLVHQRNKLSIHQTKASHQLSKINPVEKESKQKYKKCLEACQTESKQIDLAIGKLLKTVSDLTGLHTEQKEDKQKAFLSQLSSGDFYDSEERFTSELTSYTRKQFFEGFADMAGRGDENRYELLEISDPTALLIRGESEEVILNDCKELSRLQKVYSRSEQKRISAEAAACGVMAAVKLAEEKNEAMLRHHHVADADTLSHLNDGQSFLARIQAQVSQLNDQIMSDVIQELAHLQATKILRGDYHLKIARQDYFTSKQDQVINQLLMQRSRYEFLLMALEIERHKHRDAHRLFSASETGLQNSAKGVQTRTSKMSDPVFQRPDPTRGTLDSRDEFLGRLYELLDPSDPDGPLRTREDTPGTLFHTYSQLLEWTTELVNSADALKSSLSAVSGQQEDVLRQMEQNLEKCQKLAYGRATTEGGPPQLSPQRLADGLVQLSDVVTSLEQSIKDVIRDVESKKKILRSDSLKAMERDLFVCFFTDPSRLRRAVAELAARVDAQIVSGR
ncbi:HAUS augmin-like complex subunit 3 isoform X2 [Nematostella vectensis]|uniref:HAUS augmin-like complex subunit 3 isoform X2 n=1 Tax=Nematostella vectensis TaxID=45351 RepID=UPI00138FACA0|nr:HAUS augmin-like complex subunit 3 isoform X2 [Nematostella vectensis]